jgi:transposase InsO family protein
MLYRKYGIEGLKPKPRFDKDTFKSINPELENIIKSVLSDYQVISSAQLYRLLLSGGYISESDFSANTLSKYVRKHKLLTKTEKIARKRFEKDFVNELWVSDFMHGPVINKKKTYLCCIIDDHSRLITGYGWFNAENSLSLEITLKSAILRYGLPKVIYCDNGGAYISDTVHMSCARLGIALVHTKPYDPAAKGKIERFFRTVRLMFMCNANFTNIEELNKGFSYWVEKEYNKSVHSTINEKPIDRFIAGIDKTKVKRISENEIQQLFLQRIYRKVKKDSTISVNGRIYEVPPKHISESVEVRFDSAKPEELYLYEKDKPILKLKVVNLSENASSRYLPIFSTMEGRNV